MISDDLLAPRLTEIRGAIDGLKSGVRASRETVTEPTALLGLVTRTHQITEAYGVYSVAYHIEERDPKTGRIIKPSADCIDILKQGRLYNWAGPLRRMCAKCRRSAMRGSEFCWSHNPEHRKRRAQKAGRGLRS